MLTTQECAGNDRIGGVRGLDADGYSRSVVVCAEGADDCVAVGTDHDELIRSGRT